MRRAAHWRSSGPTQSDETGRSSVAAFAESQGTGGAAIPALEDTSYDRGRFIDMLAKLLVALLLMALCVGIHAVGLTAAVHRLRRVATSLPLPFKRKTFESASAANRD